MAGLGWRTFVAGNTLTAAQVQQYLQDQVVQVYASAAARTSALGASLAEGMVSYRTDGKVVEFYNGSAWTVLDGTTTVATLTNKTLTAPQETITVSATAATGTINFDVISQADLYYTTNATANFTLNFRGNSTTTLNTYMATIPSEVTVAFRNTNGATGYYASAFTIDGVSVTPKWFGGAAPTAGNASAVDVYTFNIVKTAASTYTVFASITKAA